MLIVIFGTLFVILFSCFLLSFINIGRLKLQIQELQQVIEKRDRPRLRQLQTTKNQIANVLFDENLSVTPMWRRLSVDTLLDSRPWTRVGIEQLPSIFTALGILFTFIGLVTGLKGININGGSEELMTGMGTLLDGVGHAFGSSLWGIAASSVTMLMSRLIVDGLSLRVELLIRTIDDTELLRLPEEALVGIEIASKSQLMDTRKLVDLTENQSAKIGSMASDLATQLQKTLAPSLDNLSNVVSGMANGSSDIHAGALGGIMESFLVRFDESLGQKFGELGEVLDKTLQWHISTQEMLSESIRSSMITARKQQEVLEFQNELIEKSLQLEVNRAKRINAMIEGTTVLSKQLGGLLGTFDMLNSEFPVLAASLKRAAGETLDATRNLRESVVNLKTGMDGFDARIEVTSEEYNRLVSQIRNELEQGLASTFGKFDKSTANIVDRLNGSYINLGETLEQFDKTLQRSNEVRR